MAWDAGRRRVVLFGGSDGSPLGDTWEWDGATWTQDESTVARAAHAMAYDGARGRLVVFGGTDAAGERQGVREAAPGGPPALRFTAAASGAGFLASDVTGLRVRAHCGARVAPWATGDAGATLAGWRTDATSSWTTLASNTATVAASQPRLAPPPAALLDWTAASAQEARRYFAESANGFAFQCRPAGGTGNAEVGMDYMEVRVRYRAAQ